MRGAGASALTAERTAPQNGRDATCARQKGLLVVGGCVRMLLTILTTGNACTWDSGGCDNTASVRLQTHLHHAGCER